MRNLACVINKLLSVIPHGEETRELRAELIEAQNDAAYSAPEAAPWTRVYNILMKGVLPHEKGPYLFDEEWCGKVIKIWEDKQ